MPKQKGTYTSSSQPLPRDVRVTRGMAQGRGLGRTEGRNEHSRSTELHPNEGGEGGSAQRQAPRLGPPPPVAAPSAEDLRLAIQEGLRAVIQEIRGAATAPAYTTRSQGTGVGPSQARPPQGYHCNDPSQPSHPNDNSAPAESQRVSAFDRLGAPTIHQRLGNQHDAREPAHSRIQRTPSRGADRRRNPMGRQQSHGARQDQQYVPTKECTDQTEGEEEITSDRDKKQ